MAATDGERELLRQTVEDLLAEHCTPARVAAAAAGSGRDAGPGWDASLWQVLEETGLTLAGSPEEAGGSGGDLLAAAAIVAAAGAAAAPVPLAETLAAGMLLARAGLAIPAGPLTVAVAGAGAGLGSGVSLRRVPYGRLATTVAAGSGEDGDWLAVIAPTSVGGTGRGGTGRGGTGRNLAGEPRDEVGLGADAEVHGAPAGTADYARRLLRLFRSLLIAGAAQRALDLTVTYVKEREQFGRPLAKFPTVQAELARMAGEVALIGAATQAAVAAEGAPLAGEVVPLTGEVVPAVVAAKAQASSGAGVVAAIAHQLHGAIGTTEEHRLRLTTTRLWSWRDEDGSEAECFAELGRAALGAAAGAGGLWPWLSGLAEQVDDGLGARVAGEELAAYDFHVGSPVPFGPFGVGRLDEQHQLAVGTDQLPELVLGVRVVEDAHDDRGQVHGDDLAQHSGLDGQGTVPGPLQDQVMEPLRGLRPGVRVAEMLVALHQADQVLDAGVQVVQVLLGAPGREQARRRGLGRHARLVHVGDRRPAHLEQQSDVPGGHGDVRGHHPCPAAGTAADADQGLGLQDPERLAQRRP
jgi:acyl-CoA dehydrogenase